MNTGQYSVQDLERAAAADPVAAIEMAGDLLERAGHGTPEQQRALTMLEDAGRGPQAPLARWVLASHYLQHMTVAAARQRALQNLQQAARARLAPAVDRLANLHLRGLGVDYSLATARELLQGLADCGFQRFAWELGYLYSVDEAAGSASQAAAAFARACALGYPPAYYSLGLRYALGAGVDADPAFGRALLLRAGDAGFPDARVAADELVPGESVDTDAAGRWYQALKQNLADASGLLQQLQSAGMLVDDSQLPVIRKLEAHFMALGHPSLALDERQRLAVAAGNESSFMAEPEGWQWLAEKPRVAVCRNFVSREECAHLRFQTAGSLAAPETYTTRTTNSRVENTFFTGQGRSFGALSSDSVVRIIERRIARMTDWDLDALEPSSVIRYQPGHEYKPHVDYFTHEQIEQNRVDIEDFSGQRVVTFLICIVAPEQGGETVYDRTGVKVRYEQKMAALHYNITPNGEPDPLSLHSGTPVTAGEKWLLRTTLRQYSRYQQAPEANR